MQRVLPLLIVPFAALVILHCFHDALTYVPAPAIAEPQVQKIKPYNIPADKLKLKEPQLSYTPLHMAAQAGDLAKVRELIAAGEDMEARDVNGWTPLFTAATLIHREEMVSLLIEKGANVNAMDRFGKTPLQMARQGGYKKTIAILQQHGAE